MIAADAFYILDRGYLDVARLYRVHQARGVVVTRAKWNFRCPYLDSRPSIARPACTPTRSFASMASKASRRTRNTSVGSVTSTRTNGRGSCSSPTTSGSRRGCLATFFRAAGAWI